MLITKKCSLNFNISKYLVQSMIVLLVDQVPESDLAASNSFGYLLRLQANLVSVVHLVTINYVVKY